jgi:hypothetical protein
MAKKKSGAEKETKTKKNSKKKQVAKSVKKPQQTKEKEQKGNKEIMKILNKIEKENSIMKEELKTLKAKAKEQAKQVNSLVGRLETRVKREEVLMKALRLTSRSKKGEVGVIEDLNSSILKAEKYMLHMGKRIDNVLAAIKNHREYLIKLNKKVHKEDAKKNIEMEVDIINNTLSVMALSGFDINKALFSDVKRIRKMMEKKDVELPKLRKRKERLERKFEDEMERFDYESIHQKSKDIPGYR